VTISIIAVLLGILIPTLPRVLDTAHRTACQANLRSHWQACTMHLHDHDDKFPVARYMGKPWLSGDPNPPINEALADYMGDADSGAWRCPGDSDIFGYPYEEDGEERFGQSSYTYSAALSGETIENTFFVRFLRFQPDEIPVLRDFDGGSFETIEGEEVVADFFHSERNILFADGHVGIE